MKTYKDIYKPPFTKWESISRVVDSKNNFVFQFVPRFGSDGEYAIGWLEFEEKIMDAINGKPVYFKETFNFRGGHIFIDGDNRPIITIRGWGNLTGVGGHNLKPEEAANIQDTFVKFIIDTLNSN